MSYREKKLNLGAKNGRDEQIIDPSNEERYPKS